MIPSEIILRERRRIKHAKLIFGIILIIFGSAIIIVAIWGDMGWNYYLENCGTIIMFNYTAVFALCIVLCIVLVIHGIILIHKGKTSK
jgi:predicted nucleic acid-binding Zn ribbon protein